MISLQHVWAVALKHLRILRHDSNIQLAIVFWPLLNLIIWGYLGAWMQQGTNLQLQAAFLNSLLLWQTVGRTSLLFGISLMEELWSGSLTVLFATPLSIIEWILGIMLYSVLTSLLALGYCVIVVLCIYRMPLETLLSNCLLFGPPLVLSGICIGLLNLQLILYGGKRADALTYIVVWLFAAISGVFYAREVLPAWVQKVGDLLPLSYGFSGLRNYVLHHKNPLGDIGIAYGLGVTYCLLGVVFLMYSFKKAKEKGLARLMD